MIGASAFAFRLLAEGGLPNDHYMHLAWAQQVLLGEVPGRDFSAPGMPLMYTLSAVIQHFWPGPFSEVVLTCGMMGIAAGLTFWVLLALTDSWFLAITATFLEVVMEPRLYGYPKILVPALVLFALHSYLTRPGPLRLGMVSGATAIAILLRHDLGAFAMVGVIAALVTAEWGVWLAAIRSSLRYVATTVAALTPYLLFVEYAEGISESLREGIEFSRGEAHQLLWEWSKIPRLDSSHGFDDQNAAGALFYIAYGLAGLTALLILRRWRAERRTSIAIASALVTMLVCYCLIILRHPLVSRVQDLASLLAIAGAWSLAQSIWLIRGQPSGRRIFAGLMLAAGYVVAVASTWQLAKVDQQFEESRIADGLPKVVERLTSLQSAGSDWPWSWYWPAGDLPDVVQYLNQCTNENDRIWLTWSAPEYYYFARRGFAAGQALMHGPRAFATERDRQKILARFQSEWVPVVLINESTRQEFATAYPALDAHLSERYAPAGTFQIRDGSQIVITVRRDAHPTTTYGSEGWPCGFATSATGA